MQEKTSSQVQKHGHGIPKIIHQIYLEGSDRVPTRYEKFQVSWLDKFPHAYYRVWDQNSISRLLTDHYPSYTPLYDSYKLEAQKVNMAKYVILFHHGGIMIDINVECKSDLASLIEDKELVLIKIKKTSDRIVDLLSGGLIKNGPLISTSFMASTSRHIIWKAAIRELYYQHRKDIFLPKQIHIERSTGSIVLTLCFRNLDLEKKTSVTVAESPTVAKTRLFSKDAMMIQHSCKEVSGKSIVAVSLLLLFIVAGIVAARVIMVKKKAKSDMTSPTSNIVEMYDEL